MSNMYGITTIHISVSTTTIRCDNELWQAVFLRNWGQFHPWCWRPERYRHLRCEHIESNFGAMEMKVEVLPRRRSRPSLVKPFSHSHVCLFRILVHIVIEGEKRDFGVIINVGKRGLGIDWIVYHIEIIIRINYTAKWVSKASQQLVLV